MGKNPRAYKSEKRNREVAQQKKREAKRLQRLSRKEGTPESGVTVDGIEPLPVDAPPDEPQGQ